MSNVPLDPQRLWDSLMAMARIGATPEGGNNRPALSVLDGQARALLAQWGQAIGLTLSVDRLGNMALRREGREADLPPVLVGSHLDTQPTGGRFDGPYGVLAGLEILRALQEAGTVTRAPIVLVNWSNEEGSRFTPPMLGAAGAMGVIPEAEVLAKVATDDGTPYADALAKIALAATGWAGAADPADLRGGAAYFEAHIEQGPALEAESLDIGIVVGGFAAERGMVTVTGRESHAGATPMAMRRDAMLGAAAMVALAEAALPAHGPDGRLTVSRFSIAPGADGVVPGSARFVLDFRHPSRAAIEALLAEIDAGFAVIAAERGLSVVREPFWSFPGLLFDARLCGRLRDAAQRLGIPHRDMLSGAGHDAYHAAARMPAAMLFIPCHGGLSHDPRESISPDWAEKGLRVLADAVIATAETPA